jgi:hypothetical protein
MRKCLDVGHIHSTCLPRIQKPRPVRRGSREALRLGNISVLSCIGKTVPDITDTDALAGGAEVPLGPQAPALAAAL